MRKVASQEFTCLCVECKPIYQARRLGDMEIRHFDRILNRVRNAIRKQILDQINMHYTCKELEDL